MQLRHRTIGTHCLSEPSPSRPAPGRQSRRRAMIAATIAGAVVAALLGTGAGTAAARPVSTGTRQVANAAAQAYSLPAGASDAGSIAYIKNNDIFLSSPDMATTVQVTHDGGRASSDKTGDAGYVAVSQADNGLIVAVRNQTQPEGDLQGWIWVMDRQGHVLRKFSPPQYALRPSQYCLTAPYSIFPQGFRAIRVSPDAMHIAYLDYAGFVGGTDCAATYGFRTIVVNIDGTDANELGLGQNLADVEFGQWSSNSRLLLDTSDTPPLAQTSYALYYDDLPSTTPTHWTDAPDMIDSAFEEPAFSHGLLATDGFSENASAQVMRLWTTSGPGEDISARCESVVQPDGATASDPNFSPDGSGVVWYESNGPADTAGEGIYIANTAPARTGDCAGVTVTYMIPGGTSPGWGPALPTQPFFTDISPATTFYADIMWLGEQRVTGGYPDGTYRPGNAVTRGQMAAYLYRYAHSGSDAGHCTGSSPFTDVPAASGFCGDIAWLATSGVTTGYPDHTYRPGNPVTRGQMAAYLHRLAEHVA